MALELRAPTKHRPVDACNLERSYLGIVSTLWFLEISKFLADASCLTAEAEQYRPGTR